MALTKSKLDFSNTKVTSWGNMTKILLSHSESSIISTIHPTYYINKMGEIGSFGNLKMARETRFFHPDFDTIDTIENSITSRYKCEASGKVLGGNSTITTINNDETKQCLMPLSGTTIESFQFYLSLIGQSEDDLTNPFITSIPKFARKGYAISNIVGLDYARWMSTRRDGVDVELHPFFITTSEITGIIEDRFEMYADYLIINENNLNYAKFQNATAYNNFYADQIPDQYPLPVDFLGGKITKTKSEEMNAYLKLYQKSYQLCESVGYFRRQASFNTAFQVQFYMYEDKTNSTAYELFERGNEVDGWFVESEQSWLNGATSMDNTLWNTTEYVTTKSVGSIDSLFIDKDIQYTFDRTDQSNGDWNGTRRASNSFDSRILKTLYLRPYDVAYSTKSITNLGNVKNKDIELYCEVQIMIVYWFTTDRDHKFQSVLNEDENGTNQEQKRVETIIEYESPIGTPREATYAGLEEEISAVLIYDQKHMLNVSNLFKNHIDLHKEPPAGTVDERYALLGNFDGELNPYGLIKIENIDLIIEGLYTTDTPVDIPIDTYLKPHTETWQVGEVPNIDTNEKGEDRYIYNTFNNHPELRTITKWYQKINGDMIPLADDFVYDDHNFSFDFSD